MPIMVCQREGKSGFKFGDSGKCFTGPGARRKAGRQGRAIKASQARSRQDADKPAIRNIKAQRAMKMAAGIKVPIHKPTPQPRPPKMIEASYAVRMNRLLTPYYAAIREILIPAIPDIVAQFKAETRIDAYSDKISEVFGDVEITVGTEVPGAERLASNIAAETDNFSKVQTDKQIKSVTGVDVLRSEPWLQPITDGFVKNNVELITSVPKESLRKIQTLVRTQVEAGASTRTIQKDIIKELGVSRRRAKLIARDQVGKFNGKLSELRQQESGITEYIWSTSKDTRVRHSHQILNGTKQKWSKPPSVGHPGEDAQCRCVAVAVVPGFTDTSKTQGRQIGKPKAVFCGELTKDHMDAAKAKPGVNCIVGPAPKKKEILKKKPPLEFKSKELKFSPETLKEIDTLKDAPNLNTNERFELVEKVRKSIDKDLKKVIDPKTFKRYERASAEWRDGWAKSSSSDISAFVKQISTDSGISKPTTFHKVFINSDKTLQAKFAKDVIKGRKVIGKLSGIDTEIMEFAINVDRAVSQKVLKRIFPKGKVKVFRGQGITSFTKNKLAVPKIGSKGKMVVNSLSSWTIDQDIADKFIKKLAVGKAGPQSGIGMVLEANVPIEQIHMSFLTSDFFLVRDAEVIITNINPVSYKRIK